MKIILKKEVANLGEAGDVVEVKGGYAQNYLIPQGFAGRSGRAGCRWLDNTYREHRVLFFSC